MCRVPLNRPTTIQNSRISRLYPPEHAYVFFIPRLTGPQDVPTDLVYCMLKQQPWLLLCTLKQRTSVDEEQSRTNVVPVLCAKRQFRASSLRSGLPLPVCGVRIYFHSCAPSRHPFLPGAACARLLSWGRRRVHGSRHVARTFAA
jgi:hypothetical protein